MVDIPCSDPSTKIQCWMRVQEQPAWHAAELATAVGLTKDGLRKRILFWIGQGVLQETTTPAGTVRCPALLHYSA